MKKIFLIWCLLLANYFVKAENINPKGQYSFQRIDINNGLSQNSVNTIIQDTKGFMWFGTKDGLNRYDGLSFKVYKHRDADKKSPGNNTISSLCEALDHSIWVGTDAGVFIFNPSQESFSPFLLKSNLQTQITHSIPTIVRDIHGCMWIAADGQGLFHYEPFTKKLMHFPLKGYSNVSAIYVEQNGTVWVGFFGGGLYYTTDNFKTFTPFSILDGGFQGLSKSIVYGIIEGPRHCIYVCTLDKGVFVIDRNSCKTNVLLSEDKNGRLVKARTLLLKDDNLWIGSESGLFIYNLSTKKYSHYQNKNMDPYSLSDNPIYSLCKDKENGVWIGTYFGGVNYYPEQYTHFDKYYPTGDKGSLFGKRVRSFLQDPSGLIWIGTEDGGLNYFNPANGIFGHVFDTNFSNIHGLCLVGDKLWVGTFSQGLRIVDIKTKQIVKSYVTNESFRSLSGNSVFAICRTRNNSIYLGTILGLCKYNRFTDSFERVPQVGKNLIYDLHEDKKGNFWVATYADGIYKRNSKGKWKHYSHSLKSSGIFSDKIISIYEDRHEHVWVTMQGGGISRYENKRDIFVPLMLPSLDKSIYDVVYQMVEDRQGFFWFTTNHGLIRYDKSIRKIKLYSTANGLLDNQFNYRSSLISVDHRIYLGSLNGFIAFDPSTFVTNKNLPTIVLTDFYSSNQVVGVNEPKSPLMESISDANRVVLDYDQNSFAIRAVVLSYQAPQQNKLRYRLEGYDDVWQECYGSAYISYTHVPYGHYRLHVIGANADDHLCTKERILEIVINPPFYLSIWAYIFYFLILIGIIFTINQYFHKRNLARRNHERDVFQQQKDKELYQAKMTFFSYIAHEIRTPLTLIKGPLENILKRSSVNPEIGEDLDIMNLNTDRLLNLTNQLLDYRKVEADGIKLTFIRTNITDLIKKTFRRFSVQTQRKNLNSELILPEEPIYADVDIEALTKIISNLLNNAIKYCNQIVNIRMESDLSSKKVFYLYVENDGNLIPSNMREKIFTPFFRLPNPHKYLRGFGIGLALCRSMANLHHGTLNMAPSESMNVFVLTLPVYQKDTIILNSESEIENAEPEELPTTSLPTIADKVSDDKNCILVVEDEVEIRQFIRRQLKPLYDVKEALNGKEALEILKESYINLIISDIMMPEMDGFELCRKVKSDMDYSHIPIILLTARTNLQSKLEGLEIGADAYIEKPFSLEYLQATIKNLIDSRKKLRDSFSTMPFISVKTVAVSITDKDFLTNLSQIVQKNISNQDLDLEKLSRLLNTSRSSLNRKIKGLLGMTPNEYIRLERLKKAAELIKEGNYRINEICYMVGFNTPSYFARCFQSQFGVLPKDF